MQGKYKRKPEIRAKKGMKEKGGVKQLRRKGKTQPQLDETKRRADGVLEPHMAENKPMNK